MTSKRRRQTYGTSKGSILMTLAANGSKIDEVGPFFEDALDYAFHVVTHRLVVQEILPALSGIVNTPLRRGVQATTTMEQTTELTGSFGDDDKLTLWVKVTTNKPVDPRTLRATISHAIGGAHRIADEFEAYLHDRQVAENDPMRWVKDLLRDPAFGAMLVDIGGHRSRRVQDFSSIDESLARFGGINDGSIPRRPGQTSGFFAHLIGVDGLDGHIAHRFASAGSNGDGRH